MPQQMPSDPRLPAAAPDRLQLMSRFNVAFSLMSLIPLLTCAYLITIWVQRNLPQFSSVQILEGFNGVYFLLALVIALLGLLAGHQLIRDIIQRLVEANTKLERLSNQQASFVSNVAHELRSPLAIFKGAIDNLGDGLHGALTSDQMEPVEMCRRETKRLSRLVSDLLELSRLEAGKVTLKQEEVDLQELLTTVVQLFSGPAKERGLTLNADLPHAPGTLLGDHDRLEQVFVNLIGNAIKYSDAGEIGVWLARDGEVFRIEIQDSGRGIAPEDLERIFDKFERVGTQQEEGAGLGLPIARDIVELHGGRMWAESEPSKGSRFIVILPAKGARHA